MGFLDKWLRKKKPNYSGDRGSKISPVLGAAKKKTEEAPVTQSKPVKAAKEASPKEMEETPVVSASEKSLEMPGNFSEILIRPLVSEKSTYQQTEGGYSFMVQPRTNKTEIKKAVEKIFKVKVKKVRIINSAGKKVRYGKIRGQRKKQKKALVILKKGYGIEIHKSV